MRTFSSTPGTQPLSASHMICARSANVSPRTPRRARWAQMSHLATPWCSARTALIVGKSFALELTQDRLSICPRGDASARRHLQIAWATPSRAMAPIAASSRIVGLRGENPSTAPTAAPATAPTTPAPTFIAMPSAPRRKGHKHAPRPAASPMQTHPRSSFMVNPNSAIGLPHAAKPHLPGMWPVC